MEREEDEGGTAGETFMDYVSLIYLNLCMNLVLVTKDLLLWILFS